ncbi:uncharacterized protein C7orf26 homolog [Drosophila obscura]|uniref:uncharacterized protein C7orf26 homolog n=1 Tax=Drosophila obscura TaxID=7282 RepID=UPI001BB1F527|nr:uncharacterized protein C7orf26 homolog [Drosophila obscura]XP_022211742.2 uncharacterized protein C7orf26 homolog [Drosophila obscura]
MSLSKQNSKATNKKSDLQVENFPACAVEALARIETLIAGGNNQNLVMQIISKYIFLERSKDGDGRKSQAQAQAQPTSQLNVFKEFQLTIALIEYFSKPGSKLNATYNVIFLSLFGSHLTPERTRLLCKVISLAISGAVSGVLFSAGVWLQQVGCKTPTGLEIAQCIVTDFILFARKPSETLKQLPMIAPQFAANFVTAVAELYLNEQRSAALTPPPVALLNVITEWMTECPALCEASQQFLAGLLRWAVLAPLVSKRPAYSQLHLSILKLLQKHPASGESSALHIQDLMQIYQSLQNFCARLTGAGVDPPTSEAYQKCMERFAQAVQIAIYSKRIPNPMQLLCTLKLLPSHKLMNIVIAAHKK